MNNIELEKKVISSINHLIYKKGYVAPIDVFMSINKLSKSDCEQWRCGKISYLERVIGFNLNKISFVMKVIKKHTLSLNLKPSFTVYNQSKCKVRLKFSKSGNMNIEKAYATHYVKRKKNNEL